MSVHSVAALPGSGDRYEGMEVDYHPNGLANLPVWRCTWRAALNSGSGAWAVQGAPIRVLQSASHDASAGGVNVSNMSALTVPVTGLYYLDMAGLVQIRTAPAGVVNVDIFYRRDTTNITAAARYHMRNQFESHAYSAPQLRTLTGGWEMRLRVENMSGSTTWRFGADSVPMQIFLAPVELRP
jgi:hypothetical protein